MPQTYGPSQLDGYDFSRIKALCDGFYITLPGTPGNGDVLTYNSQSQSWQANAVLFDLFSAYDHTGAVTIGTSATDLSYDTEIRKDNSYQHTAGVSGITLSQAGLYLVQADIGLSVSAGSTNSYSDIWLAQNSVELAGTRTQLYTFQNGFKGSASIHRLVQLEANDVVKVQAKISASGNTVETVADISRITLIRLNSASVSSLNGQAMGAGFFSFMTYP